MLKQLEGGLILRSLSEGVASDHANIGQFYADTFGEAGEEDTTALREWAQTLISGSHPTTTLEDVWVVVDPAKGDQIVSAVLLIPQTWLYGDIEVGVGRVELVATNKEYRRRGLVRALVNAAHERSAQLGHIMTGITGISHYYRRFGYTMGVDLGIRTSLPFFAIPKLADDQKPKYTLRPAGVEDAEQLAQWDLYRARTCALSMPRSADLWRFEIAGRHPDEVWRLYPLVIVNTQTNEGVGYVLLRAPKEFKFYAMLSYIVGEKTSYLETFDDVMRGVKAFAEAFYREIPQFMPDVIALDSGVSEAVDTLIQSMPGGRLLPDTYAWYMRIPDIAAFIRHVAPVLERRLCDSGANCYTGSLTVAFSDLTGVEMKFEQGKIIDVVERPFDLYEGDARFAFHTFLNVVFGHRTQEELFHILPETFANGKARVLFNAMFPKQRSWLYPLG
jgi:predicted N-acetyltransferase YhbS